MVTTAGAQVPKKPSAAEFFKLVSGPRVDVYVGKDKKHYVLPKDLLTHHSTFFDRCFNGTFKEAATLKLDLPEDTVDDFEILLEYMLHGSVPDTIDVRGRTKGVITTCMAVISYADKFAMGEAFCELLYDKIEAQLTKYAADIFPGIRIKPANIELVFRLTQVGSRLRTLLAKDVMSYTGLKGDRYKQFEEVEKTTPEFALEMLKQIRLSIKSPGIRAWVDPLTQHTRYD